jgi:hypothetical protein
LQIPPEVVKKQLKVVQLQPQVADYICNMGTNQNNFAASKKQIL